MHGKGWNFVNEPKQMFFLVAHAQRSAPRSTCLYPFLPACLWSHVRIALPHLRRGFIDHHLCSDQGNLISLLTLCRDEKGHRSGRLQSARLCHVRESTHSTSNFIFLLIVAQSQFNLVANRRPVRARENCLSLYETRPSTHGSATRANWSGDVSGYAMRHVVF